MEKVKCPVCNGSGRVYPGNYSEEVCVCDFCHGKKYLDWIELIIGVDEHPWKFIKRGP